MDNQKRTLFTRIKKAQMDSKPSVALLIGFGLVVGALLACDVGFNKYHLSEPLSLISVSDTIDLFTPFCLIPFYWQMFTHPRSKSPVEADRLVVSPLSVLLFILAALVWCQGHALHNSANSIANALEASQLHVRSQPGLFTLPVVPRLGATATAAHVADFYDEYLSHILWTIGICLLELFSLYRDLPMFNQKQVAREDERLTVLDRLLLIGSSIGYTAAFWGSCIEGQTVFIGLPFVIFIVFLTMAMPESRQRTYSTPVLYFFAVSAISMLLAFVVYAFVWRDFLFAHGRLPEFSEVTNLFQIHTN